MVFAAEIPCSAQSLGCIGKAASASKGAAKKRTAKAKQQQQKKKAKL